MVLSSFSPGRSYVLELFLSPHLRLAYSGSESELRTVAKPLADAHGPVRWETTLHELLNQMCSLYLELCGEKPGFEKKEEVRPSVAGI
jgi:hypothetical protein